MTRMVHLNNIPQKDVQAVLEVLADTQAISHASVVECRSVQLKGDEGPKEVVRAQIQFRCLPSCLNLVIKAIRRTGFTDFDIMDMVATTGELAKPPPKYAKGSRMKLRRNFRDPNSLFPSIRDRKATMEIHTAILGSSHITFDHIAFIVIAAGIAATGLLTDSSVDILASFFISPLMSMIMATAWGFVIRDYRLVQRGLRNMAMGASLAWICGLIVGGLLCIDPSQEGLETGLYNDPEGKPLFYGITINSAQITSRGPPAGANILSTVIIAIFSGMGIALGQTAGVSSALSGVALSASLLPPIVNSGMCFVLGFGYPDLTTTEGYHMHAISWVSICIYLVTVTNVIIFAFITFKLKHIGGKFNFNQFTHDSVAADSLIMGADSSAVQNPASSDGSQGVDSQKSLELSPMVAKKKTIVEDLGHGSSEPEGRVDQQDGAFPADEL